MNKIIKTFFFSLAILMNAFKFNNAVNYWNYAGNAGAGESAACAGGADTAKYVATYSGFLAFPTMEGSCVAAASCVAGTVTTGTVALGTLSTKVTTCTSAPTPAATQPLVTKCITGTDLTISSTLTATVDCAAGDDFCKNAYTATPAGGGYKVTASCSATCTVNGATEGCGYVAESNKILACYVGIYYNSPPSGTLSSFNKQICAANKNQYCKNVYTWTSANGYQVDGSCDSTCTYTAISLTGSGTTAGETCTTTVFGNTVSGSPTLISSGIVMLIMLFLTCQGC